MVHPVDAVESVGGGLRQIVHCENGVGHTASECGGLFLGLEVERARVVAHVVLAHRTLPRTGSIRSRRRRALAGWHGDSGANRAGKQGCCQRARVALGPTTKASRRVGEFTPVNRRRRSAW